MAETTNISWADATVNFWHGCEKVSEGCKYCYMYRDKEKFGQDGRNLVKTDPKRISGILGKLHEQAREMAKNGLSRRLRIFTCSWSDFFIEGADAWRAEAWETIRNNPEFDWLILTKRPERVLACLPPGWPGPVWRNVWFGVSAENQARFNERVPLLLEIPASIHFVSAEPLLGSIDMREVKGWFKLDWLIIGGESGNNNGKYLFRPCEIAWIESLVCQAKIAGIKPFVKQTGTHIAKTIPGMDRHGTRLELLPDLDIQNIPLSL